MNPADALEYLMANTGNMFDKELVELFMQYIAPYPIGVTIELSNGKKALVLKNNRDMLSRPVVRVESGEEINLMESLDITIVKLITGME